MLLIALLAESNLYRTCLWSALKNLNDINSWSQTRETVRQQATIVADSCCTLWASEGTCSCRNPSVAVIDTESMEAVTTCSAERKGKDQGLFYLLSAWHKAQVPHRPSIYILQFVLSHCYFSTISFLALHSLPTCW